MRFSFSGESQRLSAADGVGLVFCGLMAASLLVSRALNVAWIALVLLAALMAWRSVQSKALPAPQPAHLQSIRWVGLCAVLALMLKLLPQMYWGVLGRKVSMELNVLLAVGVAWGLTLRGALPARKSLDVLLGCFLIAALLAIWQCHVYVIGGLNEVLPTNAVNWAAGMALLLVVALAGALMPALDLRTRWLSGLAVLALSLALFMSGRRGAYFALLWAGAWLAWRGLRALRQPGARRRTALMSLIVVLLAWGAAAVTSPLMRESVGRMVLGGQEYKQSIGSESASPAAVGSVGTRLFLAAEGMTVVASSPWWGVGPEGHDGVLRRLMPTTVDFMYHFHNEYVDVLVNYGAWGLLGFLCVPLALLLTAWRLRHDMPARAVVISGLALTHLVSGLSNVNTFHNYYQTLYAICLVLALVDWPAAERRTDCAERQSGGQAA
jgi:O-antigen ligase